MATAASGRSAKGARIVGTDRSNLAARVTTRYEAGESIRSLAADLGRSYGFVQGLLKESGIALRGRGGATRGVAAEARRADTLAAIARAKRAIRLASPSGSRE